jgi:hypothetical protein
MEGLSVIRPGSMPSADITSYKPTPQELPISLELLMEGQKALQA